RRVQSYFEVDVQSLEEPPHRAAAAWDAFFRIITATISSNVKSGCSTISPSKNSACPSNGEVLPPLGFAATLPVFFQRWAKAPLPSGWVRSGPPPLDATHRPRSLRLFGHGSRWNTASASIAAPRKTRPKHALSSAPNSSNDGRTIYSRIRP